MNSMRFTLTMFLLMMIAATAATAGRPMPPIFTCAGGYYECGKSIGAQAAPLVSLRLTQHDVAHAKMIAGTPKGKQIISQFTARIADLWPHLLREMNGVAAGANVSFEEILILNSLDELNALQNIDSSSAIGSPPSLSSYLQPPQCTSVLTNSADHPCMGHNEDNVKWVDGTTYFVNATIHADDNPKLIIERYIAFAYAGTMGGNYFGWNHHGLVFSDEFIFAAVKNFAGVPSNVHARAAYGCSGLEEVMVTMAATHSTSGYNIDVGSTRPDKTTGQYRMMMLEGEPMNSVAVRVINSAKHRFPHIVNTSNETTWYRHTNMFQLVNASSLQDRSSIARRQRIDAIAADPKIGPPATPVDIQYILGDTEGEFPIYRNGTKTDHEVMTLATVVFDLSGRRASIWTENPRESSPAAVFELW